MRPLQSRCSVDEGEARDIATRWALVPIEAEHNAPGLTRSAVPMTPAILLGRLHFALRLVYVPD